MPGDILCVHTVEPICNDHHKNQAKAILENHSSFNTTGNTSCKSCLKSAVVKRQKLAWFGYITCHDSLSKNILQGTLEGGQCHGQQRKCWMDNIKEWTSLPMPEPLTRASCRKDWIPHVPTMIRLVKGLN